MTWFKVDDSFHSHPKVLAAPPAALGLWVVAGAWCSANLTDGFVPDYVLPRLLPDAAQLAGQLATCGLWRRAKGGYRFHDWSVYQPTKDEAAATRDRKSTGGRLGNHRRWHVEKGVTDPRCPYCAGSLPEGTDAGTDALPMGGPMRIRSGGRADSGTTNRKTDRASAQAKGSDGSDIRSATDQSSESHPSRPDPTRPDPIRTTTAPTASNGRNAQADEPPNNDPPGPAERVMTRWADTLTKPAQRTIAAALGAHVHQALADGIPEPDVTEALTLWQTRVNTGDRIGPGILPSLIHQVSQRTPGTDLALPGNVVQLTDRRPSTTDARFAANLALAAELATEEAHHDPR